MPSLFIPYSVVFRVNTSVFHGVPETIIGSLNVCGMGIVQGLYNLCITSYADSTLPQHQKIPYLVTCSYLPVGGTTHFSPWNPHLGSSRGTAVVPPGHTTDKVKILTLSFCGFV